MFKIQEVTDIDLAFGGSISKLMPKYTEIPDEFKHGNTKWNKLFNTWFFSGLNILELTPKDGVDENKALKHIKAIMVSYEPKHEHKEAGCAYLLNEWFSDVKYQ